MTSRHRRFTAIVQDGSRMTWLVRTTAPDAAQAARKAVARAQKEAISRYPDPIHRKMMTNNYFAISHLFHGHARETTG